MIAKLTSSPLRDSIARSIRFIRKHNRKPRNHALWYKYHAWCIRLAVEREPNLNLQPHNPRNDRQPQTQSLT